MVDLQQIYTVLPKAWITMVAASPEAVLASLQELRIRLGRPVLAYAASGEYWLSPSGLTVGCQQPVVADQDSVRHLLATISHSSLYALEEELRSGYVTIPGGHRVGLVGRAVLEQGRVKTLKHITGFNLRLARQVPGCAARLLPQLLDRDKQIHSTLLVSPPQAGKTTLLRDLARLLSTGDPQLLRGRKVAIIDERSELAACYLGVPTLDLGPRADVLDACPKAEGMMIALRALSPEVLVTDEIGRREDALAIEEALYSGVRVVTTAHGANLDELLARPVLGELLQRHVFGRYVLLSSRRGPGTIEAVYDRSRSQVVWWEGAE